MNRQLELWEMNKAAEVITKATQVSLHLCGIDTKSPTADQNDIRSLCAQHDLPDVIESFVGRRSMTDAQARQLLIDVFGGCKNLLERHHDDEG